MDTIGDQAPVTGLRLRPAAEADLGFLHHLFASTREAELTALEASDAQKSAFLSMQFRAQDLSYREQFPDGSFDIVEKDGERIGRLYVHRGGSETRVIDISLLPEWRNRGIGTALLTELFDESGKRGQPVTLHVDRSSPARRLYERLGFVTLEEGSPYIYMRRIG